MSNAQQSAITYGMSGAAGRMGRRIIAIAAEQPNFYQLTAALDRPDSPHLGQDATQVAGLPPSSHPVPVAASLTTTPQVIIDFSAPANTRELLTECRTKKIALVIGTTGLSADDLTLIDQAAKTIPVLQATNTSLGVTLLLNVAAQVARQLGPDYDIEIVEAHHNQKKDAPSGTALSLAESIIKATGRSMENDLVHGRHGADALRRKSTVGMHAVRMGDVVGEHTIYFATPGERIEIKHVATTRDTFARGALRAAAWLAHQPPGRYTMKDVLNL